MKIYHLKTCDTCRKAIKALASRAPETVEIREEGVPQGLLEQLLEKFGPDVVVNRKSTTWRNLSDPDRTRAPLELLQEHPTLLKRPVIVDGEIAHIGWTKHVQQELGVS